MKCKTCDYSIDPNARYCPNCGAKIVDERLSLKGTWEEFIGPFFSWDNNFWRTFFGMFKNPKDVLEAYISGARKKYFHPFSYIILYATVAVFFYKFFPMDSIMEYSDGISNEVSNRHSTSNSTKVPKIDTKPFMESMMNYYNFFVLLLMPVYAFTSFIVYRKRGHNFFEHLVFNSYIQTNLGFISLVLQVILVSMLDMTFQSYASLFMFIFVFYTLYILKKLYNQNLKQTIFSGFKYILLFFGLYLGVMIIISILYVTLYMLNKI